MKKTIYNHKDPFEKRLLEFVCVFIAILMSVVMALDLTSEYLLQNIIMHIALIAFSSTAYYLSSRNIIPTKTLSKPFLLTLYLAVTFYWFASGGIYGPSGVGLFCVITISFIFSKPHNRKYFLYGNLFILTALSMGHFFLESEIRFGKLHYENVIFEFLAVAYGLVILLFLLKREVDSERKTIRMKNQQLLHLNQSLKSTIEKQFKTLKELNSTQTKLVHSEKMASIGTLTAGVAHEINNPLSFVGGVVDPIRSDIDELKSLVIPENEEKADYLRKEIFLLLDSIENGTTRASQVIQKLLSVTPGRQNEDEFKVFNLSELILEITRLVRKSNPSIKFKTSITSNILFDGNEIEINQVLLNLLRNSIQAIHHEKGEIQVNLGINGNLLLEVVDNGKGMDESTVQKAFDAFYTTKENGNGTGLGLFISNGIINKHKGQISINSKLDKGTKISIFFPSDKYSLLSEN